MSEAEVRKFIQANRAVWDRVLADLLEELAKHDQTPCVTCSTPISTDIWHEELGMCLDCSNNYFTHDDEETDTGNSQVTEVPLSQPNNKEQ